MTEERTAWLWESLSDLAPSRGGEPGREFAPSAAEPPDPLGRRDFLRLVGGSAALASASGCQRAQSESLRPYRDQPAQVVPGNASFFATTMTEGGYATGLIAESHEGRPTKIEGNPEHPASLGATRAIDQAAILGLYDPDRASGVTRSGAPSAWVALLETVLPRAAGSGFHLLIEATSSPTIADQVARLRKKNPRASVRWFAPLAPLAAWEGARIALGRVLETRVDLRQAKVIVALDSDFLGCGPAQPRLARDFADGRRLASRGDAMSRLYSIEPTLSVTGMSADHRLRVLARDVLPVAAAISLALVDLGVDLPADVAAVLAPWAARAVEHAAWARAVARDLANVRGASAILVGDTQPAPLHALAHVLNAALGSVGRVITYAESPIVDAGTEAFDLQPLAAALDGGGVEALVVVGGNPVYAAPADLDFGRRFALAKESVHLGQYANETSRACAWFAAQTHFLESWGDARAFDGTVSLTQPLFAPTLERHTPAELLSALLGESAASAHDLLSTYWRGARQDTTTQWERWIERGLIPGSAFDPVPAPPIRRLAVRDALALVPPAIRTGAIEVSIRPDARVRDGAFANNAWLMEMPDPVTRLTWGNAALLSPATAATLGASEGSVLTLEVAGRTVRAPALVAPGQADDSISISLGYGRSGDGETIARGVGANAFTLRTASALWFTSDAVVRVTGEQEELAIEQRHAGLEGRDEDILLHRTLDQYRRDPSFARAANKRPLTLYEPERPRDRQWGMVIDLNACTGCGSCVVACQAENNIPVVGKTGVAKGRAMHWLRIDRYFLGNPDDPKVLLEPMLCQHCEKAPCEYVCPVNATTHSSDGLNQMIYNRCVGTRFCSNNCPYKVRRFNWFDYHQGESPLLAGVHNPDVTVRARGVMEKCTYCVQRIREAEIRSNVNRRPLVDGDVRTACEQACASRAITFGDIADEGSRVARLRANERAFAVLNDLGARPRTRYLARITNPNPEMA